MNSKRICAILIFCASFSAFNFVAHAAPDSVGQDIKQDAKTTGHGVANGAREVGHATSHVARKVGHGAKDAGVGIGHGAKEAGLGIGHGAREGWDASRQAVKQVFHKGH
ncbi:MAG: hypothetical protein ABI389_09700 [Rhodanobacter sp.]